MGTWTPLLCLCPLGHLTLKLMEGRLRTTGELSSDNLQAHFKQGLQTTGSILGWARTMSALLQKSNVVRCARSMLRKYYACNPEVYVENNV